MMSIATELTTLANTKSSIKTAIEAKGVTVGAVPFADYPSKISEISGGGTSFSIPDQWTQSFYNSIYNDAVANNWTRPTDWLAMPTITETDQQVNGLVAVYSFDTNWISFSATGAYTVDWGDGSATEDFASGAVATHNYVWTDIDPLTETTDGFRQVIVTITPQAGQTLSNVNFNQLVSGLNINHTYAWLDIQVAMNGAGTINLGQSNPRPKMLRKFRWLGTNSQTDFVNFFAYCYSLRIAELSTVGATNMAQMFQYCESLTVAPQLDTSSVSNAASMFTQCRNLITTPQYDFSSVISGNSLFSSCTSLLTTPSFTFNNSFTMTSNFNFCTALLLIGDLYFNSTSSTKVLSQADVFSGCTNLRTIPQMINNFNGQPIYNSSGSNRFDSCRSLERVENYRITATSLTGLFTQCSGLKSVSIITTTGINIASFSSCFSGCSNLEQITFIGSAGAPATFTPNGLSGTFSGCNNLKSLELSYNTSTITASPINNLRSLSRLILQDLVGSIDISNNALGPLALEETFTSLGTAAAKTITITGNWGAALLTQAQRDIAINKGWSIVG